MTRRPLLFLSGTLAFLAGHAAASEPLNLFDTEAVAQQHCRGDAVVWLDVPSNRYWFKGQKGYGTTKNGDYACKSDADRSGNHPVGGS